MAINQQHQGFIKQRSKIHIKAWYFTFNLNLNSTNKERKYNKDFVEHCIFLKITKRGDPNKVWGLEKLKKLLCGGRLLGT